MERQAGDLTDEDFTALARVLWEEEERMLPNMEGRSFADLTPGEIAYYRNCATVVAAEAERLRIKRR